MTAPYYCRPRKDEQADSDVLNAAILKLRDDERLSFAQIALRLEDYNIILTRSAVFQRYHRFKRKTSDRSVSTATP